MLVPPLRASLRASRGNARRYRWTRCRLNPPSAAGRERLGSDAFLRTQLGDKLEAPGHHERGHRRRACLTPALRAVAVGDIQRFELDAALAEELLGRCATRSGRMPEEQDGGTYFAKPSHLPRGPACTRQRPGRPPRRAADRIEPPNWAATRCKTMTWRRGGGNRLAVPCVHRRSPTNLRGAA